MINVIPEQDIKKDIHRFFDETMNKSSNGIEYAYGKDNKDHYHLHHDNAVWSQVAYDALTLPLVRLSIPILKFRIQVTYPKNTAPIELPVGVGPTNIPHCDHIFHPDFKYDPAIKKYSRQFIYYLDDYETKFGVYTTTLHDVYFHGMNVNSIDWVVQTQYAPRGGCILSFPSEHYHHGTRSRRFIKKMIVYTEQLPPG